MLPPKAKVCHSRKKPDPKGRVLQVHCCWEVESTNPRFLDWWTLTLEAWSQAMPERIRQIHGIEDIRLLYVSLEQ